MEELYTFDNNQTAGYLFYNKECVYDYDGNKQFALKQCGEFAAVYPLHVPKDDINCYHPHDATELYCDFFKKGEYLYSLRRNKYYPSEEFLVEFFTRDVDNKIVFIFNKEHGIIDICDPENGKTLHTDKPGDIFIKSHKVLDDGKYMFFCGWYWSPLYFNAIYDIQKLISEENYEPTIIEYKSRNKTMPDFLANGNMIRSETLKKNYNLEHVLVHFNDIETECKNLYTVEKFNKNREKNNNILRDIWNISTRLSDDNTARVTFKDEKSKTEFSHLMENNVRTLQISCIGKTTSDDLSSRYYLSLINKYDTDLKNLSFNRKIIRHFTCGFDNALPISGFSLHFIFTFTTNNRKENGVEDETDDEKDEKEFHKFYLDVDQDLEKDEKFDGRYKVVEYLSTKITIGIP